MGDPVRRWRRCRVSPGKPDGTQWRDASRGCRPHRNPSTPSVELCMRYHPPEAGDGGSAFPSSARVDRCRKGRKSPKHTRSHGARVAWTYSVSFVGVIAPEEWPRFGHLGRRPTGGWVRPRSSRPPRRDGCHSAGLTRRGPKPARQVRPLASRLRIMALEGNVFYIVTVVTEVSGFTRRWGKVTCRHRVPLSSERESAV